MKITCSNCSSNCCNFKISDSEWLVIIVGSAAKLTNNVVGYVLAHTAADVHPDSATRTGRFVFKAFSHESSRPCLWYACSQVGPSRQAIGLQPVVCCQLGTLTLFCFYHGLLLCTLRRAYYRHAPYRRRRCCKVGMGLLQVQAVLTYIQQSLDNWITTSQRRGHKQFTLRSCSFGTADLLNKLAVTAKE